MTEAGQNLLDQALRLSADERAVLAANLWASLGADSESDVEAAWAEEIRRRLKRIESGVDQPVPWGEIRGRLRANRVFEIHSPDRIEEFDRPPLETL